MRICLSVIYALISFSCCAQTSAASFDCRKAHTIIERAICDDAELSSLDEIMSATYRLWLTTRSNKIEARSRQNEWLKIRDRCSMREIDFDRQSCLKD